MRDIDHLLDFRGIQGGRFFREHMFPRLEALDRQGLVEFVRDDDADGIDLLAPGQHRLDRIERLRNVPFFRRFGRSPGGGIGHSNDFGTGLTEARRMILQHSARANHSYFGCHDFIGSICQRPHRRPFD